MTIEQMGAIMDVLTVAYPQYYRNASNSDKFLASQLWAEMFADDPPEVVIAAVKSFIATDAKGWPPSIGIIKDHILKITTPSQKSALEAWAEIKKALKNSGYGYVEEFEKLDVVAKRIVGSALQLREWAQVDTNTLDTVIASNFRESYGAISKTHRDRQVLPPAVSELVHMLAEKMDVKPAPQPKPQPKALPISVEAIISETKAAISGMPIREIPKPLTDKEVEKKRAEIMERFSCSV